MSCESEILDPTDVIAVVRDELQKPTIKDWLGRGTTVSVQKLDSTRAWREHLPSLGIRLEGGLLRDSEGNHCFVCMQRRGQPQGSVP